MSPVSGVSGEIKESAIGLVESAPPVLEGRGCGLACRDGGRRGEAAIRNFTSFVGGLKVLPLAYHQFATFIGGGHPTVDVFSRPVIAIARE